MRVSPVAATSRVFHMRATLVRPTRGDRVAVFRARVARASGVAAGARAPRTSRARLPVDLVPVMMVWRPGIAGPIPLTIQRLLAREGDRPLKSTDGQSAYAGGGVGEAFDGERPFCAGESARRTVGVDDGLFRNQHDARSDERR